jgi:heme-degrading monooxygenase HmoA
MTTVSVTVWLVKPGREEEFVRAWRELAEFTERQMVGHKQPTTLLRDRDQPNRFITMAPWDSAATLRAWRSGPGFGERVHKMREYLEELSPMTLDDITRG